MIRAAMSFVAETCGGERVGRDVEFLGVGIDSREIRPGMLFIPLVGERADGHAYTPEALRNGAAGFVWGSGTPVPSALREVPHVRVPDTLAALQSLAAGYRRGLSARVVGVTGSNGKTSTKELIAAVLSPDLETHKSPGNQNSHIGLPLALLAIPESARAAVLEMGMRGPGEIEFLCRLAEPAIAVVTNIGEAHLGRLGSREAIAAAKWELVQSLPLGGIAVLPDDEPLLARPLPDGVRAVRVGESPGADIRMTGYRQVSPLESEFWVEGVKGPVKLRIPGRHQARNALCALAVAEAFGISRAKAADRLAGAKPVGMRMEASPLADGGWLLNDAYNAAPSSVRAALEVLRDTEADRRIAVLGDMLELGARASRLHEEIGAGLREFGVTDLIAVGEHAPDYIRGGALGISARHCRMAADADEAVRLLRGLLEDAVATRQRCAVLVKGSRRAGLERVAAELFATGQDPSRGQQEGRNGR